jgi:hypothetical protein
MKKLLLLLLVANYSYAQPITTQIYEQKKWVLHTNINLPAAKYHFLKKVDLEDELGHLELFSSYGVGLSLNYGTVTFVKDVENDKILPNETKFRNIFGFQGGLLFSSKVNEGNPSNFNNLSVYTGLNVLDLQLGIGYELSGKLEHATGWFATLSYGIPIHTISKRTAYIFDKKNAKYKYVKSDIAMIE